MQGRGNTKLTNPPTRFRDEPFFSIPRAGFRIATLTAIGLPPAVLAQTPVGPDGTYVGTLEVRYSEGPPNDPLEYAGVATLSLPVNETGRSAGKQRRGTILGSPALAGRLQGGVEVPTGGEFQASEPARERLRTAQGQQIRCNSGADGQSL